MDLKPELKDPTASFYESLNEELKRQLIKDADELIEKEVEEFRNKLESNKWDIVSKILQGIEIFAVHHDMDRSITFNVSYKPQR